MERRYAELRREGRKLSGVAIRYGDVAEFPWGRERFTSGAFTPIGDVMLNAQHDRTTPLARTGAGLELRDGPDALELEAALPKTRAADDVLELVRAGVLRGLSVEFAATSERMDGGVRVIDKARLAAVGVVDTPAYPQSGVEARRRGGRGGRVRARVPYRSRLECVCHRAECEGDVNEVQFEPGAFKDAPETLIAVAKDYASPLASARRGTLRTRETDDGLEVEFDLPDTEAARDLVAASANVPLIVRPLFDQGASDFIEADGVATYSRVALRAWLIGATDRAGGWPDATVEGPKRSARRRLWL